MREGIPDAHRSQYQQDMLDYILDDLMPHHRECIDFSLLEVNRYKFIVIFNISK